MSEELQNRNPEPTTHKWTVVARVLHPQGRRGEVLAAILTDFPASFENRKRFFLINGDPETAQQASEIALDHSWLHKGHIVLKFAGVDSISDAEALGRPYVAIPHEERMPLDEGAFYTEDLIGMTVFDVSRDKTSEVGAVTEVISSGGGPAMLQLGTGTDAALIPFVQAYLKNVDFEQRRIEMELPEGLLDLNAPPTARPGQEDRKKA